MVNKMYLVWALFLPGALGTAGGADLTLNPGVSGSYVVNAVIDRIRSKCILGDDRLFLRRLAYVETNDGKDSKTYRSGYDGGIWQVDKSKFLMTKTCPSSIASECSIVQSAFNIDWRSTSWADLRKPLYSGLASALYIKENQSNSPPGDVASQASFWASKLRPGGSQSGFITKARAMKGIDCRTQLDLTFILDGSGSVSRRDFQRMIEFVKAVVTKLDVSKDAVKIAVVEYASKVGDDIKFQDHTTKSSLLKAIGRISKSNGGTNTAAAILHTFNVLLSPAAGARANAKRVAILLTDGKSNDKPATISPATKAKAAGITMISVGIGNADETELRGVATHPSCTHVIMLNSFKEIDSLLYQLKDSSCGASTAVEEGHPINKPLPENGTVEETFVTNEDNITSPDENKAVIVKVVCGTLEMYSSYNTPRPGPAFYDVRLSVTDGRPGIMHFNEIMKGRPLYITVIGTRLTIQQVASCINASYSIDINQPPTNTFDNVTNPCSPGDTCDYAHPSDTTKFIHCDTKGNMFVTQCPGQTQYDPDTVSCGPIAIEGGKACQICQP
ncbi:uncharacterized protein [Haliotis cracherodii]|uniref:uncharacterized protein n=1 Tax=Haliotis cracherodii TaxID=6455 RepID=UPI0039EB27C3